MGNYINHRFWIKKRYFRSAIFGLLCLTTHANMANEIKLEVLAFGIRKSHTDKTDKENYFTLSEVDDGNSKPFDFFDFVTEYLVSIQKQLNRDDHLKRAIRLNKESLTIDKRERIICGFFEAGGYGYESDIYDKDNEHKLKKLEDDVEIMPYYFLFYIPHDRNVGVFMLERFGGLGISTIFHSHFSKSMKAKYDTLMVDFDPLLTKELMKAFTSKGAIKEVVLRKYNLPSDVTDKLHLTQYASSILGMELRFITKKNKFFSGLSVNKFINDSNTHFYTAQTIKGMGFDNNFKVSVVSSYKGNKRTIDLSESLQIRPYYDIHEEVKLEKGHPTFESIHTATKTLLAEIIPETYKKIKNKN
jgi:hypothetical protein